MLSCEIATLGNGDMKTEATQIGSLKGMSWVLLVIGCVAALAAYWQSASLVEKELQSEMDLRAAEAKYLLEGEIGRYTEVLRGLQAQFVVDPHLSRRAFRQFSNALHLQSRLPGIQAVVYTQYIPPGGADAFVEVARRELAREDLGYPPPVIHPRINGKEAYVVQYNEPIDKNAAGAWFDQGSEPKRRAAIERARDTGEWSMSGRVRLAVHPGPIDGVIFFLPVYSGGITPTAVEQRRKQFIGVVLLVIRIEEMLRQVFGHALLSELDIEIHDAQDNNESVRKDGIHNIIFDSGIYQGAPSHANNPDFPLKRRGEINMGGSIWHLEVTALPEFTSKSQHWLPPIAALTVFLLSLLMFYATRTLEISRRRMQMHARQVEEALHSKETQLERIADSINAILWRIEMPSTKLTYVSSAVTRISGRPMADFLRDPTMWMSAIHPADRDPVQNMLRQIASSGNETFQFRVVRPNGEVRWICCEAHFTPGTEPGSGFIDGINNDITEQRLLEESLRRSNRALRAIHECEEAIATLDDEKALLQTICDVVVKAGYQMAWAGVLPDESRRRIIPVGLAGEDHGYLDCIGTLLETGEVEQFPTILEAIHARRPSVANSFETETASKYLREEATRRGLKSKITLPLVHEETTIGILNVYAAEQDAFDAEGVVLLTDMVQSLAVAIRAMRDRSGRRAAEAMARLRERAMEASANAIIITRAKAPGYAIEYVNSAFERMTGYTAEEVIGRNPGFLHRDDREQPGLAEIRAILQEKREGHAVVRNYHKDGTPFWSDIYIAPVRNECGEVTHFVAAKYDVTATKKYEAELEFQANHDALTGMANRNLLHDRLNQAIAFASRYGHSVWVVFVNLDRFKIVNETLGFAAGDLLLKQIADRLRSAVCETDTVARLSGDEFVLILPERGDDTTDTAGIQRLMQAVALPLSVDGHEFVPTCSVGVSAYPTDGSDAAALIKQAHIAMYRAKESGRNSVQFYTPAMNERIIEHQRIERDLRNALDRGEFELHYQPQVELSTGKIVGMEALLRWQHPQLGTIPPMRFIGLAEETGLIVPIGAWVLHTACLQTQKWQQAGYGQLRVAVNLSSRQFIQLDLAQTIAAILEQTGLPAHSLDIELTESMVMADVEQAVGVLGDLKKLGVHVSIDDFGTGYSSLAYLKRFPIDMLKIDKSFVRDIATDPDDAAIVRSVISLAHSLRLQVIAEGVETEAQLSYLRRHACDQMQGFLFSRPLSVAAFEQLLMQGGIAALCGA